MQLDSSAIAAVTYDLEAERWIGSFAKETIIDTFNVPQFVFEALLEANPPDHFETA
ncbi:MAG: hypothetical protein ABI233_10915 [Chthoniobacterales bacterium]